MLQAISNGIFGFVHEPHELAHHISEIVLDRNIWHMPLPKKHTVCNCMLDFFRSQKKIGGLEYF